MSNEALTLFENGTAHGLAAIVLFNASAEYGKSIGIADEEVPKFQFNGPCSLSVFYLIGLSLELQLKAAYVALGGDCSNAALRAIGHDLEVALAKAQELGFEPSSNQLLEIVGYMNGPYREHTLRYERPDGHYFPEDIEQISAIFETLSDDIKQLLL